VSDERLHHGTAQADVDGKDYEEKDDRPYFFKILYGAVYEERK
jgi:hypothetical protein